MKGLSAGQVNQDYLKVSMKESIKNLPEKNEKEYCDFASDDITRASLFDIKEVVKQYYDFFINASSKVEIKNQPHKIYINGIIRQFYKFKVVTKLNQ